MLARNLFQFIYFSFQNISVHKVLLAVGQGFQTWIMEFTRLKLSRGRLLNNLSFWMRRWNPLKIPTKRSYRGFPARWYYRVGTLRNLIFTEKVIQKNKKQKKNECMGIFAAEAVSQSRRRISYDLSFQPKLTEGVKQGLLNSKEGLLPHKAKIQWRLYISTDWDAKSNSKQHSPIPPFFSSRGETTFSQTILKIKNNKNNDALTASYSYCLSSTYQETEAVTNYAVFKSP